MMSMNILSCRKADADASMRPPLFITMSTRTSLSVFKGPLVSNYWQTDIHSANGRSRGPMAGVWFAFALAR